MKLMRSEDIMTVPITQVEAADWDIRNSPEDEAGIIALANSIKKDGFINPITCIKQGKKYVVIAGRRRLKAAKRLNLKEIPIYLREDINEAVALRRVALIENCHRKDMVDSERAYGFVEVYKQAGYTKEQAYHGVKSIDNWFSQEKGRTWDQLTTEPSSVVSKGARGPNANPLRYDPKFIEICKDIGFTPKYQYQLLEIIMELPEKIVKLAEQEGIAIDHQIMLTNKALRGHDKIQKELIEEIANDLPKKRVKERIQQVAMDLATGYLKKNEDGDYVKDKGVTREIVKGGGKVLDPIQLAHMDISQAIKEFLFRMTNRAITHGEFGYTKQIVNNTKDYRLQLMKVYNDRELMHLENDLELIGDIAIETLEMIDAEFESRKIKKGMLTK